MVGALIRLAGDSGAGEGLLSLALGDDHALIRNLHVGGDPAMVATGSRNAQEGHAAPPGAGGQLRQPLAAAAPPPTAPPPPPAGASPPPWTPGGNAAAAPGVCVSTTGSRQGVDVHGGDWSEVRVDTGGSVNGVLVEVCSAAASPVAAAVAAVESPPSHHFPDAAEWAAQLRREIAEDVRGCVNEAISAVLSDIQASRAAFERLHQEQKQLEEVKLADLLTALAESTQKLSHLVTTESAGVVKGLRTSLAELHMSAPPVTDADDRAGSLQQALEVKLADLSTALAESTQKLSHLVTAESAGVVKSLRTSLAELHMSAPPVTDADNRAGSLQQALEVKLADLSTALAESTQKLSHLVTAESAAVVKGLRTSLAEMHMSAPAIADADHRAGSLQQALEARFAELRALLRESAQEVGRRSAAELEWASQRQEAAPVLLRAIQGTEATVREVMEQIRLLAQSIRELQSERSLQSLQPVLQAVRDSEMRLADSWEAAVAHLSLDRMAPRELVLVVEDFQRSLRAHEEAVLRAINDSRNEAAVMEVMEQIRGVAQGIRGLQSERSLQGLQPVLQAVRDSEARLADSWEAAVARLSADRGAPREAVVSVEDFQRRLRTHEETLLRAIQDSRNEAAVREVMEQIRVVDKSIRELQSERSVQSLQPLLQAVRDSEARMVDSWGAAVARLSADRLAPREPVLGVEDFQQRLRTHEEALLRAIENSQTEATVREVMDQVHLVAQSVRELQSERSMQSLQPVLQAVQDTEARLADSWEAALARLCPREPALGTKDFQQGLKTHEEALLRAIEGSRNEATVKEIMEQIGLVAQSIQKLTSEQSLQPVLEAVRDGEATVREVMEQIHLAAQSIRELQSERSLQSLQPVLDAVRDTEARLAESWGAAVARLVPDREARLELVLGVEDFQNGLRTHEEALLRAVEGSRNEATVREVMEQIRLVAQRIQELQPERGLQSLQPVLQAVRNSEASVREVTEQIRFVAQSIQELRSERSLQSLQPVLQAVRNSEARLAESWRAAVARLSPDREARPELVLGAEDFHQILRTLEEALLQAVEDTRNEVKIADSLAAAVTHLPAGRAAQHAPVLVVEDLRQRARTNEEALLRAIEDSRNEVREHYDVLSRRVANMDEGIKDLWSAQRALGQQMAEMREQALKAPQADLAMPPARVDSEEVEVDAGVAAASGALGRSVVEGLQSVG